MNPKKQASPQTIVGMVVAIIAAVAFAFWNISRSLGGGPAPPAPAANAPPAQTAATAAKPASPTAGVAPVSQSGPQTASAKLGSDANIAPGADPFGQPLPAVPQQPAVGAQPPAQNPNTLQARTAGAVTGYNRNVLPPVGFPPGQRGMPLPSGPAPIIQSAPLLVGTMTGDMPSAVFKGAKQLAIVSVGDVFNGWQVLAVTQSSATVKGFGRTVRLKVGASSSASVSSDSGEVVAEAKPNATFDGSGRLVQGIAVDPPDSMEPADPAPGNGTDQTMVASRQNPSRDSGDYTPQSDRRILVRAGESPVRVASTIWFVHAEGLLQGVAQRNAPPSQGTGQTTTTTPPPAPAGQAARAQRQTVRRTAQRRVRSHRVRRHHRHHRVRRHRYARYVYRYRYNRHHRLVRYRYRRVIAHR